MQEVTLYHMPNSFYSQIARVALAEKGVGWRSKWIAAGPPTYESYKPWYMHLNPEGTVPTMVHDGQVVPDSFDIARYVDANFEGPPLIPSDEGEQAEMEHWIEKLGSISVRELSYGDENYARAGAWINRSRIRNLKRRERKNRDLADIYRAKRRSIEEENSHMADPGHMELLRATLKGAFDEIESTLAKNPWLVGGQYSLADTFWTVTVAQFILLKSNPLEGRPALAEWYSRIKARPSFETAGIWDSNRYFDILPLVAQKFLPWLVAPLLAITGLWALLWWLL